MLAEQQFVTNTDSSIDQRIAEIIKEAQAVSEYQEVWVTHLACSLCFAEREIVSLKATVSYLREALEAYRLREWKRIERVNHPRLKSEA